ncbi:hypothetical protein lerEdw1_016293 [Lerista edwardsae]|nr:hypothetical protein lerEdw1_016293 [Lerista edwardsae]
MVILFVSAPHSCYCNTVPLALQSSGSSSRDHTMFNSGPLEFSSTAGPVSAARVREFCSECSFHIPAVRRGLEDVIPRREALEMKRKAFKGPFPLCPSSPASRPAFSANMALELDISGKAAGKKEKTNKRKAARLQFRRDAANRNLLLKNWVYVACVVLPPAAKLMLHLFFFLLLLLLFVPLPCPFSATHAPCSDPASPKKCRARFGLNQQMDWCGPCRCVSETFAFSACFFTCRWFFSVQFYGFIHAPSLWLLTLLMALLKACSLGFPSFSTSFPSKCL